MPPPSEAVAPKPTPESDSGLGKGVGKKGAEKGAVPIAPSNIPRTDPKSSTPIPVRAPVETLQFRGPPRVRTHYQAKQLALSTKYPPKLLCLPSAKPKECIGIDPKGKWIVPTPKSLLRVKAEVRRPRVKSSGNSVKASGSAEG